MISSSCAVKCDGCEETFTGLTQLDYRRLAQQKGWLVGTDLAEIRLDFCPECRGKLKDS